MPTPKQKNFLVTLILLSVVSVGGLGLVYFALCHRQRMSLELDIRGSHGAIPKVTVASRPVEQGLADWPCWRGPQGDVAVFPTSAGAGQIELSRRMA